MPKFPASDTVPQMRTKIPPPRIALYSPGMVGLGHMRRNLLIAQVLASSPLKPIILMIAEAREASAFSLPPGVDLLSLPALMKDTNEQCRPRYLGLPVEEVSELRKNVILSALVAFNPDVMIVDHLPRGAMHELDPSLEYLRYQKRTYSILGLRDVLDEPAITERKWRHAHNEEAIRSYYDAVWVYGDPRVYDLINRYRFSPDIRNKMQYMGYLDQRIRLKYTRDETEHLLSALELPPGRLALCLVGGGQDGERLTETFARTELPEDMNGVVLSGPFMPSKIRERLRQIVDKKSRMKLLGFVPEPNYLLEHADRVVGMGGYNTTCEVLSFEKPALIIPRVKPGREQWIRAQRLHQLGLVEILHPSLVNPESLSRWLALDVPSPSRIQERIDMQGTSRLYWHLWKVLRSVEYREANLLPNFISKDAW